MSLNTINKELFRDPDSDSKEELITVSLAARKRLMRLMSPAEETDIVGKRSFEYANLCKIFEKIKASTTLKLMKYGQSHYHLAVLKSFEEYQQEF